MADEDAPLIPKTRKISTNDAQYVIILGNLIQESRNLSLDPCFDFFLKRTDGIQSSYVLWETIPVASTSNSEGFLSQCKLWVWHYYLI